MNIIENGISRPVTLADLPRIESALVSRPPESQSGCGAFAVAAGSLPVSSAEAIIQKWSEHRNFAAHQQQRAPIGTLERRAWKERRNLIEEMLNDMGRLAGLPIPRQPEENTAICHGRAQP